MHAQAAIPRQRQPAGEQDEQAQRPLRVLTINPGSASLKLAVLDGETLRFGHALPGGTGPPSVHRSPRRAITSSSSDVTHTLVGLPEGMALDRIR
ncbi:MAG: hypothetical protein ACRDRM_05470 [Pseudonocardiaceae bacterium]